MPWLYYGIYSAKKFEEIGGIYKFIQQEEEVKGKKEIFFLINARGLIWNYTDWG